MSEARFPATRRKFLKTGLAGAGVSSVLGFPSLSLGQERARPKLRVALIGTGGIGASHIEMIARNGDVCSCYCDVDTAMMASAKERWPGAKAFQDYRRMIEGEADQFDAVMVGVPDHHHYPATVLAMKAGKHVYTQKPLTHTVWEARELKRGYEANPDIVSQMGNQGHAHEGNRLIYEWVNSGAIGEVLEVHCFTDRPTWPQPVERPEGEDLVPLNLDWDTWLGPAQERPFKEKIYHSFVWRGWWDFGTGTLGDMACHTMDCAFWALGLGAPTFVEPVATSGMPEDSFPGASVIRMGFRREGSDLDVFWYDSGLRPPKPSFLEVGLELPRTGVLLIGSKAAIVSSGDYGDEPRIIPDIKSKEVGRPPKLLDRSPGHYEEWRAACLGEKPREEARSNFGYSAVLTEAILLGNLALKLGRRLEYDADEVKISNLPEANVFVKKTYRDGWDIHF